MSNKKQIEILKDLKDVFEKHGIEVTKRFGVNGYFTLDYPIGYTIIKTTVLDVDTLQEKIKELEDE